MKNKCLLGVIGSLPRPVGGVTTFLDRFVRRIVAPDIFLDYVFSNEKPIFCNEQLQYFVSNGFIGSSIIFIVKELERIIIRRSAIIWFINYSTPGGVLRCILLPRMPGAKWVLMLHNGELRDTGVMRYLPFSLIKWLLGRFDTVLVISQKQASYYSRYVSADKLVSVKSYLPAPNYGRYSSIALDRFLAMKAQRQCPVISLSGYALKEYGYELFFEAISSLMDRHWLICICCYGDQAERVQQFIPVASLDRVVVFCNLSEHAFIQVLRATDIYVRPNLVDSFGVAVADVVSMGKVVIASDVCERVPGAVLFRSGDVESLRARLRLALDGQLVPSGRLAFDKFTETNTSTLCSVFGGGSN